MARARPQWDLSWAAILAGAAGVLGVGYFAVYALLFLLDPYVLNYGEGINFHAACRLLAGGNLYPDINTPPYFYYTYPPVYPAVSALAVALCGPSMLGPRLVSVLSEVGVAWLLFRLLRRRTAPTTAFLAAGLLLGVFAAHRFHGLGRVDFLQLFWTALAVERLAAWDSGGGKKAAVAAVAAFVLSLLTKPTSLFVLAAVGGVGLWGWLRRRERGRELAALAGAGGLAYGLVFLILCVWTDGGFYRHTVAYQALSGFDFTRHEIARYYLVRFGLLSAVGLVGLALLARRRAWLGAAGLVSFLWAALASYKHGADLNYTLEPLFFLVVGAAGLTERLPRGAAGLLPLAAFALAAPAVFEPPAIRELLGRTSRQERALLDRLTREADGPLLAEEPFFAARRGKEVWLNDPYQLYILTLTGHFNLEPVLRALAAGRVRRVFLGVRLSWYPGVLEILGRRYRPVYRTRVNVAGCAWDVYDPWR